MLGRPLVLVALPGLLLKAIHEGGLHPPPAAHQAYYALSFFFFFFFGPPSAALPVLIDTVAKLLSRDA